MTELEKKIIRFKYQGMTYPEISKAIGGKFSAGTLAHLFEMDGRLYLPYLQHQAEQEKWSEGEIRKQFKRKLGYLSKLFDSVLQAAIKSGDFRLARDMINDAMDRGEFTVIRKSQTEDISKCRFNTYDEYLAECRREGLDPVSGLRTRAPQMGEDQSLRA